MIEGVEPKVEERDTPGNTGALSHVLIIQYFFFCTVWGNAL